MCHVSLPLLFELNAECFQCHGHGDVAADRENEVHPLPLVEALPQRRPRRVLQFVFFEEFVDAGQHRAVEGV
jgi:hypothetical protein